MSLIEFTRRATATSILARWARVAAARAIVGAGRGAPEGGRRCDAGAGGTRR